MNKKSWVNVGGSFLALRDNSTEIDLLEPHIYHVRYDQKIGCMVDPQGENFQFPFKVYGLNNKFIDKVERAYANTEGNFGIILNGIRGTGKTITAEQIANRLGLPILVISNKLPGLSLFLADIKQDVVIVVDEFEKVFKGNMGTKDWDDEDDKSEGDDSLLTLMDGVLRTEFRRTFILTTNDLFINRNMLDRPGRIRYLKTFGDLTKEQVEEICDDLLKYPDYKEDIITYLKTLEIVTVDIVKAIITEINIFNECPEDCCLDLNIRKKDETYRCIQIINGEEEEVGDEIGVDTMAKFQRLITTNKFKDAYINSPNVYLRGIRKAAIGDNTFVVYDANNGDREETMVIRFEKKKFIHSSWAF